MTEREDDELWGDYLWDKSGVPDPRVVELERLLASARYDASRASSIGPAVASTRAGSLGPVVAMAAAVVACFAWVFFDARPTTSSAYAYALTGVEGRDRLRVGERVAASAPAWIHVADLGEVELRPGAVVRLEDGGREAHELFLERGGVHATIIAEPRVFKIGTHAGMTVDLGCEYDLRVDDEGNAHIEVVLGQVAFQRDGREVVIPRKAVCFAALDVGPDTPVMIDADPDFVRAVRAIEFADEPDPAALERVLEMDRGEDSVSLWNLLDAPSERVREAVYERLARSYPQEPWVTPEGILSGNEEMRDSWLSRIEIDWRR